MDGSAYGNRQLVPSCWNFLTEAKAIYRILGSEPLNREAIPPRRQVRREQTERLMVQTAETLRLVQNTASLNHNTHTEGIGYISGKTLG
ncbi:MAG: hypothetical protein LBD29_03515 [Treponema sp.]|nr:hypothetical protein [Treponema sp.]